MNAMAPVQHIGVVHAIQARVAKAFGVELRMLLSPRRARVYARPRQVAMFLALVCTTKSSGEIARCFDRDHTTVLNARTAVQQLMRRDEALRELVTRLQAELTPAHLDDVTWPYAAAEIVDAFAADLRRALRRDPVKLLKAIRDIALEPKP